MCLRIQPHYYVRGQNVTEFFNVGIITKIGPADWLGRIKRALKKAVGGKIEIVGLRESKWPLHVRKESKSASNHERLISCGTQKGTL